jgi:hypothetical protein
VTRVVRGGLSGGMRRRYRCNLQRFFGAVGCVDGILSAKEVELLAVKNLLKVYSRKVKMCLG